MTETLFESVPLSPDEAAARGYVRLHVGLGAPALGFSTYVRRGSLVLPRGTLGAIAPAGVATLASIHVPEAREAFLTNVDAFVFDHAIGAQPCADYSLVVRGFAPLEESGQRGLLVGGRVGILYENGRKVRGARSHAVARGRIVLVLVMEFPFVGSDAALAETGIIAANLAFDVPEATRFLPEDAATLDLPLPGRPFALAFPSNLKVTLNSFPEEAPEGVVLFVLGEPENASGLMTFGSRHDASREDAGTLDAWAMRIAEQYRIQNPTLFGEPNLEAKGILAKLEDVSALNGTYCFRADHLALQQQCQIRVVVVADGHDRYAFSMMTLVTEFEDFHRFLVYAASITAHEMMVDSVFRRLTGRGF